MRRFRAEDYFSERDFPLQIVRVAEEDLERHSHDFTELVLILSGSGRHLTDKGDYPIATGDVFVIRSHMWHGYADTCKLSLVNVLFSPRRLNLPLSDLGDVPGYHALFRLEPHLSGRRQAGALRLSPAQLGQAVTMLDRLEQELSRQGPGHRFLARAHLMELIGWLSRCYAPSNAPENQSLLGLGRVLSYMEQHMHERISVASLARVAAISESTLTRTFRSILGHPPGDYLIQLRISKAMEMLQRDDLRITDVAARCGFDDSNYFSRQFRLVAGRTPREYRKTARLTDVASAAHSEEWGVPILKD